MLDLVTTNPINRVSRRKTLALNHLKALTIFGILLVGLSSCESTSKETSTPDPITPLKVLYITHYPGKYHDYKAQTESIMGLLPKLANVEVTLKTENIEGTYKLLKAPDFAKGYDAIIYNLCMAHNEDMEMAHNMIEQTRTNGVPAVLIHCAMHTFWVSFGTVDSRKGKNQPALKKAWSENHSGVPFPDWSKFTGLNTKKHDHQRSYATKRATPLHPIVKKFPEGWVIDKDELYQNVEFHDTATAVLNAFSVESNKDHVIAWVNKVGESQVFATTLGHGLETFDQMEFHQLIANGLLFVTDRLTEEGDPLYPQGNIRSVEFPTQ